MSEENYTHLTLVVDRSGSMMPLAKEVSNSINQLVKEQREIDGGKITLSIVQFDDRYDIVESFVPAAFVQDYELVPRGMTAMNDSVFKAIRETEEKIANLPEDERPSNIVVTIVTDGFENASQEVSNQQLKSLIEAKEASGWSFVFMASNIDANQTGAAYGITNTRNMAHTGHGHSAAYASLSSTISTVRTANTSFDAVWAEDEENN